jgi:prepilin-type N-terminal cleavage/methylation domain-containing protein
LADVRNGVVQGCALGKFPQVDRSQQAIRAVAIRTKGFTILEVCVVLFIVAVIFVVAVPPATHLMAEESLQRPIRELQTFAKTARRKAMMEDRAYAVLLLDDGYVLQPVTPEKNGEPAPMKYQLPSDVRFEIKRPGEREFKRTEDARWIFSSNGLCEPLTFLFQQHGNWVRFGVDPLTATVQQRESFIR